MLERVVSRGLKSGEFRRNASHLTSVVQCDGDEYTA